MTQNTTIEAMIEQFKRCFIMSHRTKHQPDDNTLWQSCQMILNDLQRSFPNIGERDILPIFNKARAKISIPEYKHLLEATQDYVLNDWKPSEDQLMIERSKSGIWQQDNRILSECIIRNNPRLQKTHSVQALYEEREKLNRGELDLRTMREVNDEGHNKTIEDFYKSNEFPTR